MDATYTLDPRMVGTGLLIGRLVLGLIMAAHGAQKLFGWFGGYGLNATGEFFVQLGFAPGRFFAAAASAGELASGLLLALVHWEHGLFAASNGIELPLLYAAGAVGIALAGPGPWSLDALLGIGSLWTPKLIGVALAVGTVGGFANLLVRRKPLPSGNV